MVGGWQVLACLQIEFLSQINESRRQFTSLGASTSRSRSDQFWRPAYERLAEAEIAM